MAEEVLVCAWTHGKSHRGFQLPTDWAAKPTWVMPITRVPLVDDKVSFDYKVGSDMSGSDYCQTYRAWSLTPCLILLTTLPDKIWQNNSRDPGTVFDILVGHSIYICKHQRCCTN